MRLSWACATVPLLLALLVACSSSTSSQPTSQSGDHQLPLNIAHRGARSLAPENTLAAARKALEMGADLWELDVAVTSDGELVVLHDDTLERTCNVAQLFPARLPWRVWDFTLAEIQTLDCGSWYNETDPFEQIAAGHVSKEEQASFVGEPMPTLRQALEFTRDNSWRVNVELKDQPNEALGQTLVQKTVEMIRELEMDRDEQVLISSFNHDYLAAVHGLKANIPIQALTNKKIDNLSDYLAQLGTNACNPKNGVWSLQELSALGQSGIQFSVYTVNDEREMRQLVEAHVAGIFTDFPQTLRLVLNELRP
jgi:glycerophosphoryl diester phosphodiesterase